MVTRRGNLRCYILLACHRTEYYGSVPPPAGSNMACFVDASHRPSVCRLGRSWWISARYASRFANIVSNGTMSLIPRKTVDGGILPGGYSASSPGRVDSRPEKCLPPFLVRPSKWLDTFSKIIRMGRIGGLTGAVTWGRYFCRYYWAFSSLFMLVPIPSAPVAFYSSR